MKKVKYFYNTQNLRYEKLNVSMVKKVRRVLGYVVAVLVTGFVIALILDMYVDSPAKNELNRELSKKIGGGEKPKAGGGVIDRRVPWPPYRVLP